MANVVSICGSLRKAVNVLADAIRVASSSND